MYPLKKIFAYLDGEMSSKHTSKKWLVIASGYQIPSHDDY
jgi:hypothetical protein